MRSNIHSARGQVTDSKQYTGLPALYNDSTLCHSCQMHVGSTFRQMWQSGRRLCMEQTNLHAATTCSLLWLPVTVWWIWMGYCLHNIVVCGCCFMYQAVAMMVCTVQSAVSSTGY